MKMYRELNQSLRNQFPYQTFRWEDMNEDTRKMFKRWIAISKEGDPKSYHQYQQDQTDSCNLWAHLAALILLILMIGFVYSEIWWRQDF